MNVQMLERQKCAPCAVPASVVAVQDSANVAAHSAVLSLSDDSSQLPTAYELPRPSCLGSPGQLALLP